MMQSNKRRLTHMVWVLMVGFTLNTSTSAQPQELATGQGYWYVESVNGNDPFQAVIADLQNEATYQICRSEASALRITNAMNVFVDGQRLGTLDYSLEAGSCIFTTGKKIEVQIDGNWGTSGPTFDYFVFGTFERVDNFWRVEPFNETRRWRYNIEAKRRGQTHDRHFRRVPLTTLQNVYRICQKSFEGSPEERASNRNETGYKILKGDGSYVLNGRGQAHVYRSRTCTDVESNQIVLETERVPVGFDFIFVKGTISIHRPD